MSREISNAEDLIDRDMYEFYKENRRTTAKGFNQYKFWRKGIKGLISIIKKGIIENENGVYLEDFGYFYMATYTEYMKRVSVLKKELKKEYTPSFIFEDIKLQNLLKYTSASIQINPKKGKEYYENLDTIRYKEQNKKSKWKN
jgi:hypothetical protein|tara:strand:- start:494 stop:922 length:429 start_codon:yes stop_codon:yes gene_type:complete